MKPTVLVLMGGPDAERDVSLCSGREVAAALRASGRFNVIEQIIDRPTLPELRDLSAGANVIFPALHGQWGEGGPLQELLESLQLPYVGSRPAAAALAMDKLATKAVLSAVTGAARDGLPGGIPSPPAQELRDAKEVCRIDPPLVLKPVDDGSSVDLRICRTNEDVIQGRRELHPRRGRIMAERYIQGRELTVGIVLGDALPIIEIVPYDAVEFYDYAAKYTRDDTRYLIDPPLPAGVAERCTWMALTAFERIGCRDLARVDIMLDSENVPWFLEINTMPGFTTHSLVPMAARQRGVEMPELCARLVAAAWERTFPRSQERENVRPLARS